jgi:hypothetical protein
MGRTPIPLIVGCVAGHGFGFPPKYEIEIDDTVQVIAVSACSVCFDDNGVFDDQNHKAGTHTWTPKIKDNRTVTYRVGVFETKCQTHVENTYSIKIGSG